MSKKQDTQEITEKTAEATAALKRDASAVAKGVREGWSRDKVVNINTASKDQLMTLPGLDQAQAGRVIDTRPYNSPAQLVTRRIVPQPEYDKISGKITATR